MTPYILRFAIANVILTVAAGLVTAVFKLESNMGLAVAATLTSSFFAGQAFAKDNARAPTAEESRNFAWWAVLAMWSTSLVLVGLVAVIFAPPELVAVARSLRSGITWAFLAGLFLFTSALFFIAIRWTFRRQAKAAAQRRNKP